MGLDQDWEQLLKSLGLSVVPLSQRYKWLGKTRKVLSIETHLARLDDPDTWRETPRVDPYAEDPGDPLQRFAAQVPERIRRIAEMDHRWRTQAQKEELEAWCRGAGRRLAIRLGLRGKKRW